MENIWRQMKQSSRKDNEVVYVRKYNSTHTTYVYKWTDRSFIPSGTNVSLFYCSSEEKETSTYYN